MQLKLFAMVAILGLGPWFQASAASKDAICERLSAFEAAPFEKGQDGLPVRRSVTFYWTGPWLVDMEWGCKRNSDPATKTFCAYLMDNTSLEFRAILPIRVLSCYGYQFPKSAGLEWHNWTASVKLRGHGSVDRSMLVEIDLADKSSADGAVRITVLPHNLSRDDKTPDVLKSSD